MAQQLKRWESPRKEGRNDKGRGGSARRRQKAKQFKRLKQTLIDLGKTAVPPVDPSPNPTNSPPDKPQIIGKVYRHSPQQKGSQKRSGIPLLFCDPFCQ